MWTCACVYCCVLCYFTFHFYSSYPLLLLLFFVIGNSSSREVCFEIVEVAFEGPRLFGIEDWGVAITSHRHLWLCHVRWCCWWRSYWWTWGRRRRRVLLWLIRGSRRGILLRRSLIVRRRRRGRRLWRRWTLLLWRGDVLDCGIDFNLYGAR